MVEQSSLAMLKELRKQIKIFQSQDGNEDITVKLIDNYLMANFFRIAYLIKDSNKSYHFLDLLENLEDMVSD